MGSVSHRVAQQKLFFFGRVQWSIDGEKARSKFHDVDTLLRSTGGSAFKLDRDAFTNRVLDCMFFLQLNIVLLRLAEEYFVNQSWITAGWQI